MGVEKKQSRGREQFRKVGKVLCALAAFYKLFPMKARLRMLERHRNTRGKLGLGIRYALLKAIARSCGDNVAVYPGVYLLNAQNLDVGSNVSIQPMAYIECGGGLCIEDDVSIAHGVTVMTTSHAYADKTVLIKDQGVITKPVRICKNVWIGAKATILAGVTIASGCVVGANAVVTKSTEEDKIYGGTPAKVIKER